jgi:hypothetical protein
MAPIAAPAKSRALFSGLPSEYIPFLGPFPPRPREQNRNFGVAIQGKFINLS